MFIGVVSDHYRTISISFAREEKHQRSTINASQSFIVKLGSLRFPAYNNQFLIALRASVNDGTQNHNDLYEISSTGHDNLSELFEIGKVILPYFSTIHLTSQKWCQHLFILTTKPGKNFFEKYLTYVNYNTFWKIISVLRLLESKDLRIYVSAMKFWIAPRTEARNYKTFFKNESKDHFHGTMERNFLIFLTNASENCMLSQEEQNRRKLYKRSLS